MDTLSLHEAALSYAQRGYPVFPVKAFGKAPVGGHGFKDATVEVRRVDQWWKTNHRYNIGLSCEPMLILDVDRKNGGDVSFARMCEEIEADVFDGVPFVDTPGGRHYWYRRPEPPIRRRTNLRPGIDLLGVGGYAIAPPSVRKDGSYIWGREFADDAEELLPGNLPAFPRVVHDYLIGATPALVAPKLVAVRSLTPAEFGKIGEGWRNTRLTSLAGTLVAAGYGNAVESMLHAFNKSECDPPLPASAVDGIIQSVARNFGQRYVEWQFIEAWLRSDFGTDDERKKVHALRLLVLYAKLADQIGVAAPNEAQVMNATGLSERHYRAARVLLETAGAIVVQERGRTMTTLVVLQWKPVVVSHAA